MKISRKTGELVWILGNHENWKKPWSDKLLEPVGDVEWQYHQHDPSVLANGNIMCFDNGNHRTSPPDGKSLSLDKSYSRAAEFRVDPNSMTVEQPWAFSGNDQDAPFAIFVSGATQMRRSGNVFVTFGGVVTDVEGNYVENSEKNSHIRTHLFEVKHDEQCEKVFEAVVGGDLGPDTISYHVFRSEYLSDFYRI